MHLVDQLRAYLAESDADLLRRITETWQSRAGAAHPPLVLFGAGTLGRKVRAALASSEFQILAFADNDPQKWGTSLDGLPVLSPAQAAERFGKEACFVVTIWRAEGVPHRYPETERQLRALGVGHVAHFGHLAWVHPAGLLPHYSLDHPGCVRAAGPEILAALDLFPEERSRTCYLRHALWRSTLNFELLPPTDPEEIYFPAGLHTCGESDVLVDAGAFDGDTCRRMLDLWGDRATRIHAFEPDPVSAQAFRRWQEASAAGDRIRFHPMALGAQAGTLRFQGTGSLNATASLEDGTEIPCGLLDSLLGDDPPDFIKMDIEGAELEALKGASRLLQHGPRLAVCLYHVQHHLWTIPLLVHALMPEHRLYLRNHGTDAWELVLYAVPRRSSQDAS